MYQWTVAVRPKQVLRSCNLVNSWPTCSNWHPHLHATIQSVHGTSPSDGIPKPVKRQWQPAAFINASNIRFTVIPRSVLDKLYIRSRLYFHALWVFPHGLSLLKDDSHPYPDQVSRILFLIHVFHKYLALIAKKGDSTDDWTEKKTKKTRRCVAGSLSANQSNGQKEQTRQWSQ